MILLDTNIISELMKHSPSNTVIYWIDHQDVSELYISTVTIAEISYGINALPKGKCKQTLIHAFDKTIQKTFKHRILSFDQSAALIYGEIMGHRKALGRPFSILDGQIAAMALSQEAMLATRNIRDFLDCDLTLINPFD